MVLPCRGAKAGVGRGKISVADPLTAVCDLPHLSDKKTFRGQVKWNLVQSGRLGKQIAPGHVNAQQISRVVTSRTIT